MAASQEINLNPEKIIIGNVIILLNNTSNFHENDLIY